MQSLYRGFTVVCFHFIWVSFTGYVLRVCLFPDTFYIVFNFSQRTTKTYNKTSVTSKYSDQPVHPPSMAKDFIYPSLDSQEAVKDICNQRRFLSDCTDAQADPSLSWSHMSYCRFYRALALFIFIVRRLLSEVHKYPSSVSVSRPIVNVMYSVPTTYASVYLKRNAI